MKLSQPLASYRHLEHRLIRLFRHFDGLCQHCFNHSVTALRQRRPVDRRELCCCLVDNQVQDHWQTLNAAQTAAHGPQWHKLLDANDQTTIDVGRRRLPGNGPCPALGCAGCVLKNFRPPTCSTQICPKMLRILNNLGVVQGPTTAPRQIEALAGIGSPLNELFGLPGPTAAPALIRQFEQWLDELDRRCQAMPRERWVAEIAREQEQFERLTDS